MATEKKGLQAKLLALQASVRGLTKDAQGKISTRNGGSYSYDYISGSKLLSLVRPKMDELGLRLTQDMESAIVTDNGVEVTFRFRWIDTESNETEECKWFAVGVNNSIDKAVGSAATYAERYFLLKQLHLQTDEDDSDALDIQKAPAKKEKPEPTYEDWVRMIAEGTVNRKTNKTAKQAYIERFRPTHEELEALEASVEEYKRNNNIK